MVFHEPGTAGPRDTGTTPETPTEQAHPAGPHAKPHLTNPMSTPGSGMLPDVSSDDERKDVDPAGG
ncbi:hypothetical protein SAMN02745172_00005 [Pseudoxanthobacter soli DSM 19599]|uniref:Uncharacterized protein n=1 Tax=Pseudoxanthobacter soli DSM 19599 TaxID=1123029 RepID=A0A1M7Z3V4_9HYPH|nr:hypothetical protein [Pseudoxanthobacter soli]SHO59623.1 hypothetical protein SAMN02745172_00005 [Pseudoxanthobacter soli DSM 19599]